MLSAGGGAVTFNGGNQFGLIVTGYPPRLLLFSQPGRFGAFCRAQITGFHLVLHLMESGGHICCTVLGGSGLLGGFDVSNERAVCGSSILLRCLLMVFLLVSLL